MPIAIPGSGDAANTLKPFKEAVDLKPRPAVPKRGLASDSWYAAHP